MSVVRVREKVFRNISDEKGNQGVGDFRFINILQFFSIYYYYFIIFSILFFTHDIYPYLAHTHTRDPHSRPTTSPHYPVPTNHDIQQHSTRLCIKVGRGQGDGDIGTRVWGRGTRDAGRGT